MSNSTSLILLSELTVRLRLGTCLESFTFEQKDIFSLSRYVYVINQDFLCKSKSDLIFAMVMTEI